MNKIDLKNWLISGVHLCLLLPCTILHIFIGELISFTMSINGFLSYTAFFPRHSSWFYSFPSLYVSIAIALNFSLGSPPLSSFYCILLILFHICYEKERQTIFWEKDTQHPYVIGGGGGGRTGKMTREIYSISPTILRGIVGLILVYLQCKPVQIGKRFYSLGCSGFSHPGSTELLYNKLLILNC